MDEVVSGAAIEGIVLALAVEFVRTAETEDSICAATGKDLIVALGAEEGSSPLVGFCA